MPNTILVTKLQPPPVHPERVQRQRLFDRLNEGLSRKLTLISAPAGFGKTTLVADWAAAGGLALAWVTLDEGENDPRRFLLYLLSALGTVLSGAGASALGLLQAPQPTPPEAVLTLLLNDMAESPEKVLLVLDDYHRLDSRPVDGALAFLLAHLPPSLHILIATREDPFLPLAGLRARGQLTELRAADLRFTLDEAAVFLNRSMGLDLSAADVAALEARTEGWIAGLQLAALSMQSHPDTAAFIRSFTGSHRFVLDYLMEEVLARRDDAIQAFLLQTSILDQLCAPLCEALVPGMDGRKTLAVLESANLFIIPLDQERRWYRYHHLFADLLRQRLAQQMGEAVVADLHHRASAWYEADGQPVPAFRHAAAAGDVYCAARLVVGEGMPLHFRGALSPVLNWLSSLPERELEERPVLWVMYASVLSMSGDLAAVEPRLQAAEAALARAGVDTQTADPAARDLIGHIAAIRALLAAARSDAPAIIAQSQRALAHLAPDNLAVRTATIWKMGLAYHLQGDRDGARQAYADAADISRKTGNRIIQLSSLVGLGLIQALDGELRKAAETFQETRRLAGEPRQLLIRDALLGLARIHYEWNDLAPARRLGESALAIARQVETEKRQVSFVVFMTRLLLAEGDPEGAAAALTSLTGPPGETFQGAPEAADVLVRILLRLERVPQARALAFAHDLPFSRARVLLAEGAPQEALAVLTACQQEITARGWVDESLRARVLQSLAHEAAGERTAALADLAQALSSAEPGGYVRLFVDEGPAMAALLGAAAARGIRPVQVREILGAFEVGDETQQQPLLDPLSPRELEVLDLIARGQTNQEIGDSLFIALSTVKGHTRRIYEKLGVKNRTEAVALGRELGLI